MPLTSASQERIWSRISGNQTKMKNRLGDERLFIMIQIVAGLRYIYITAFPW